MDAAILPSATRTVYVPGEELEVEPRLPRRNRNLGIRVAGLELKENMPRVGRQRCSADRNLVPAARTNRLHARQVIQHRHKRANWRVELIEQDLAHSPGS